MMDPTISLFYCMFMVTCFDGKIHDPSVICPSQCQCYDAPKDGIVGTDGQSYVCESGTDLFITQAFKKPEFNTLVLRNGNLNTPKNLYYENGKPLLFNVRSLIFDQYDNPPPDVTPLENDIFDLLEPKQLRYLTFINTKLTESLVYTQNWADLYYNVYLRRFDWEVKLARFEKLEAIYIQGSVINVLESSFSSVLPALHTLVITNSNLRYIVRDTFWVRFGGDPNEMMPSLKKLVLSKNALLNLNWLTSSPAQFNKLYHLDLSENRIRILPENLQSVVPNLKQLYLGRNHFKYFSHQSIKPWFNIAEFQPISLLAGQRMDILYLTEEMEWLLDIEQDFPIDSAFVFESLWHGVQYWNDLLFPIYIQELTKDLILHQKPNQLHMSTLFNADQNAPIKEYWFTRADETNDGQAERVPLIGMNLLPKYDPYSFGEQDRDIWWSNRIVLQRSLLQTRWTDPAFLDELKISNRNAIRVVLFGQKEYEYLCGRGQLTDTDIALLIDDVLDFLDDARDLNLYVLPILWNFRPSIHNDISLFNIQDYRLLNEAYSNNKFRDRVLKPLIESIGNHPSLIGLEIADLSFDQFEPDLMLPCHFPDGHQPRELLRFLEYMSNAVTELPVNFKKEIGIGLESNCRKCLPWFVQGGAQPQCLSFIKFKFVSMLNNDDDDDGQVALFGYGNIKSTIESIRKGQYIQGIFHVIPVKDWNTVIDAPKPDKLSFVQAPIRELMDKELLGYFIQKLE